MSKTKQFPAWLQRTILLVFFFGGAWNYAYTWWAWWTQ